MPIAMPSRREFIALSAALIMIVAFAIDAMLPALPAIARGLGVTRANDQQFVITAFMVGLGVAQFFVGILSDSWGRRLLLLGSLAAYALCGFIAAVAPSFTLLLVARVAQGLAAGGARVVAVSVVRDRFAGREMAQVMSLTSVVFMAAPIVAPTVGTLILAVAPWRYIFVLLGGFGAILWLWVWRRLPETLAPAERVALQPARVIESARIVLTERQSLGYTFALTLLSCAIFGYLTSVQQIFASFGRADFLPIGFAIMAVTMAFASFLNARIVMRFGMRRIGHIALLGFVGLAVFHMIWAAQGLETMWSFVVLQSAMMACFPLAVGNFGALAMERMGAVAGTASSLQGSFTTVLGALGGALIGQRFNGSTIPLYEGITAAGVLAIAAILIVERGRLFQVHAHPVEA